MKIVYVMCLFALATDCANEECHLPSHPSVEYRCFFSDTIVPEGISPGAFRVCRELEPGGTVVSPHCRSPNYYSTTDLSYMRCKNGNWDHIAKCIPECGLVTPAGEPQVLGGESAKQAEVPWHAGIYSKTTNPYMQLCGGTLISNKIVISAAHCFWDNIEGKISAKRFAVAVGKLYRPWNEKMDKAQQSDVKELHLPEHFQGSTSYYQADIAVVIVTTPFQFNMFVRPVCVDFDLTFEKIQLQPGKMGKVAGWGLTDANGNPSPVLKVIDLPYIGTGLCITKSPDNFRPYITSDKFCAGFKDAGKAVCKGDSGGGLVFAESVRGKERHYLRGIVSAAPSEDLAKCNANAYTTFTQLQVHEHFVKQFWVAEDALNANTELIDDRIIQNGDCKLPPFPEHGSYVTNVPSARPGHSVNFVLFNVTCDEGYSVDGTDSVYCYNGLWPAQFPRCVGKPCGVAGTGVCTKLSECPSALKDLRNALPPEICAYSTEPVVCCIVNPQGQIPSKSDSCTKDGVAGMCTDLSMCPAAVQDIKNRKTPQICSFNKLIPVVCCVIDSTTLPGSTTVKSTTTTEYQPIDYEYIDESPCEPVPSQLTASKNGQKAWDKCMDYQQLVFPCERLDSPPSLSFTKGRVNKCYHGASEPIVIWSQALFPNEFPHAALLGYGNDSQLQTLQWLCGGAVISNQYILTAAHCTSSREYGPVTYVALQVTNRADISSHNLYKVKRSIRHPDYRPLNKRHDIALIELENPIYLDSFIVPACLDTGNSERTVALSTSSYDGRSDNATQLNKIRLSKFSTAECAKLYPGSRRLQPYNETTQLCYGHRSQLSDICQDDGGSPLLVESQKISCMYTIIGISSYGKGCFASTPGVYTKVQHYLSWIEGVVWP